MVYWYGIENMDEIQKPIQIRLRKRILFSLFFLSFGIIMLLFGFFNVPPLRYFWWVIAFPLIGLGVAEFLAASAQQSILRKIKNRI